MTLRYHWFGIPGNEDEFLDRERRRSNEEVQIYVQTYFKIHPAAPYATIAVNKLFVVSRDGRDKFEVKMDSSYFPENATALDTPMRDDRSPLVKRLKEKGFNITSRGIGSVAPEKSPSLNHA